MTDTDILSVLSEQILKVIKHIKDNETKYEFVTISKIENNEYYVKMRGGEYKVPNSTNMTFILGNRVIVCIPNNVLKNRFIIGKG